MRYLIAVYDMNMAFAGREEGGWWYDCGSLARVVKLFNNKEKAYDYARRLNRKLKSRTYGPNAGRHEYTSVLSEGEFRARVCEDVAPKGFPDQRPLYE